MTGEIVLIEYVEERPLLLSNPGMAAKLINLWRLSKEDLRAEQELARDKAREFGDGGVVGGGSGEGFNGCPPRISRETLGASAVVLAGLDLDRAHAGVPDFPQGQTVVLDPEEPSPFLGQVEDQMRQVALFTNLFKAPLFEHQARTTDLLLVRASALKVRDPPSGAAAGEAECYAVREIPRVYLCGQQEPLVEVMVPEPGEGRFKDLCARLMKLAVVMRLAGQGGAGLIDCVRMFDGLYDMLSGKEGREKEKEKVRACVLCLLNKAPPSLPYLPTYTSTLPYPWMTDQQNNQVIAQLRQVGRQVPGAVVEHWALNPSVSVDEVLRDVTPEEVSE